MLLEQDEDKVGLHRHNSIDGGGKEVERHIRTVALIPGNGSTGPCNLSQFALQLQGELQREQRNGSVLHLSASSVKRRGFDPNGVGPVSLTHAPHRHVHSCFLARPPCHSDQFTPAPFLERS